MGAIVHARIQQVIFGALEPKAGVACSQMKGFEQPFFNHKVELLGGILESECSAVIKAFFKMRRAQKKQKKLDLKL